MKNLLLNERGKFIMLLILLIFPLAIFIFFLIIFYWILKKNTRIIETEETKSSFTIKLNKITKRLKKIQGETVIK
jgi:hypothetical protein